MSCSDPIWARGHHDYSLNNGNQGRCPNKGSGNGYWSLYRYKPYQRIVNITKKLINLGCCLGQLPSTCHTKQPLRDSSQYTQENVEQRKLESASNLWPQNCWIDCNTYIAKKCKKVGNLCLFKLMYTLVHRKSHMKTNNMHLPEHLNNSISHYWERSNYFLQWCGCNHVK